MKFLDRYNESDLIFFDMECVRAVDKLKKGTPIEMAWQYKARHSNEMLRKTGEQMTPEEYFHEKGALYPPFAKIVSIVAGRIVGDKLNTKVYSGEEKELLTEFNNDLDKIVTPVTSLVGWMNRGFDEPFIFKRMVVNGIKSHNCLDHSSEKPWEGNNIDLGKLWQNNSFYPDSLMAVAMALGIPVPKSIMDGSEVSNFFYSGKIDKINSYCTDDVLTTANIFRKFKGQGLLTLKTN